MITTNKTCDDFLDDAFNRTSAGVEYKSLILYREELKDLVIQKASIYSADFIDCGFEGTIFDETKFTEVIFKLCDLTEATFAGAEFKHVRFVDCKIDNADFSSATFENCEFVRCDGPIITEDGDLTNVNFCACDLQDSNMSDTAMFDVAFRECNLDDISFEGAFAMEVIFEKTSVIGANLNWGAFNILETDGYFDDTLKLSESSFVKRAKNALNSICHNAVLITG